MIQEIGAALSQRAGAIGLGMLWLAAGIAALAPAEEAPRDADARGLRRVMETVGSGPAVALSVAPNGDVWWVTADGAVRFEAGEPGLAHVALELPGERDGFPGGSDPISAAHLDAAGALWLGTRHGSVWQLREDGWREVAGGFRTRDAPITAIATRGAEVYVAGPGLWRGPRDGALEEVPAFTDLALGYALALPEHGLAVVAGDRVWRGDVSGWWLVWSGEAASDAVSALAMTAEGELWIGTRGGLVRLDRVGNELRELPGREIVSLSADSRGSVYAGTRGAGLFTRYASGWRPVDDASGRGMAHVTALASAPGGALWLALADGGLLRAGPATSRPHVSAR